MLWILYELLLFMGFLAYVPKAIAKRRLPHAGWTMRLGRYPAAVRERLGRDGAIWVHAVSVGEVLASQPLLRQLREAYPDRPLVLSTVTPAGHAVAVKHAGEGVVVIYGPMDFGFAIRRALAAIRPRALLLVESELWPNLLRLARRAGVAVAVVNGRVSNRSYRRFLRLRRLAKPVLRCVDLFLMQTKADGLRIRQAGALSSRIAVTGSLKWDASLGSRPTPAEVDAAAQRLGMDGADPVLVAGSTHRGEEDALVQVVRAFRRDGMRIRLILAPRHLERLAEVEALVSRAGLSGGRLSALASPASGWEVVIVDTMGQLPVYYALASVVFVGGSLIPHGGQNPLEPATLGKPILVGPFMHNFTDIVNQLRASEALCQLTDASRLGDTLRRLLADREASQAMGRRAQALTEQAAGASQRTVAALQSFLGV